MLLGTPHRTEWGAGGWIYTYMHAHTYTHILHACKPMELREIGNGRGGGVYSIVHWPAVLLIVSRGMIYYANHS